MFRDNKVLNELQGNEDLDQNLFNVHLKTVEIPSFQVLAYIEFTSYLDIRPFITKVMVFVLKPLDTTVSLGNHAVPSPSKINSFQEKEIDYNQIAFDDVVQFCCSSLWWRWC
jgi:hypothetical protein